MNEYTRKSLNQEIDSAYKIEFERFIKQYPYKHPLSIYRMNIGKIVICSFLIVYAPYTIASQISQRGNKILITNKYATITLNTSGTVESVVHEKNQYLKPNLHYFSRIYSDYDYKTPINANSIELLPDNILKIRYQDSTAIIHIKVFVHDKYFSFKTIKAIDFPDEIKRVRFIHFNFKYNSNKITKFSNDTLFMQTLPMNTETRTMFDYADTNIRAGFESSQAAVIIAPKSAYYDAVKTMILDYALPDSRMDGVWFRESPIPDESYLFATLSKSNYLRVLDYAKKMKVSTVLLVSPLLFGHYNQPRNRKLFSTIEDFFAACDKIIDAGIKLGIHSHFNRVSIKDSFFQKPARNLLKYQIGVLESKLNDSAKSISLANTLDGNPEFNLYAKDSKSILIGNEVMQFSTHNGTNLHIKTRGYQSRKISHPAGTKVYILPYNLGSYFLNTENPEVIKEYTNSLGTVIDRLKINYLYFDGHSYPAITETHGRGPDWVNLNFKHGVMPLMKQIGTKDIRYQFGETHGQFNYYLANRMASWDGVEYGNKAFTKQYKLPLVSSHRNIDREFGWWKIHGSQITHSSKSWDTDAVTSDDLHYVMLKAFALKRGVGTQLASRYKWHGKLNKLFDTIGMYNDFIDLDRQKPQVSESYREYLAQPGVEAELQKHEAGYRIVEKITHKQYAHWTKGTPYEFNLHNPYRKKNHAMVRIYPRFDYFLFNDHRHDILEDFSGVSDWKVTTRNNKLTCSISKGGVIALHNSGGIGNWCMLRKRFPAMINLSAKRGLGLSIDGVSGNELFVVKISGNAPGFFNQYGQRDYRFNLDFTGKKNLILGNPLAETQDRVGKIPVNFPISTSLRFWTFDYSKVNTLTLYIGNIKKGAPYKIRLNELKALQEKGDSKLVKPILSVNNQSIEFPETLSIKRGAPYVIEYDGNTGKYQIFDSDYHFLSKGKTAVADFKKGNNILQITSDLFDNNNSSRAMIDVNIYADPNIGLGVRNTRDTNASEDYPQPFFPLLYNSIL